MLISFAIATGVLAILDDEEESDWGELFQRAALLGNYQLVLEEVSRRSVGCEINEIVDHVTAGRFVDASRDFVDAIKKGLLEAPKMEKRRWFPFQGCSGSWSMWLRSCVSRLYFTNYEDFSGIDLSDMDLSAMQLIGITFKGANLARADLGHSELQESNFTGADLRGAKFNYSDLRGAIFEGADLTGTDFWYAKVYDSDVAPLGWTRTAAGLMKAGP